MRNMYSNCRTSSLLEWKIIVDQDAEDYLLQSIMSKERRNDTEIKAQKPERDKNGIQETHHTTKFTRYTEKGGADSPLATEQTSTEMEAATEQETKKKTEERWKTLQKKLTRKAITDMMEQGYITREEGESEIKELEKRRLKKEEPPKRENTGKIQEKYDNHPPNNDQNNKEKKANPGGEDGIKTNNESTDRATRDILPCLSGTCYTAGHPAKEKEMSPCRNGAAHAPRHGSDGQHVNKRAPHRINQTTDTETTHGEDYEYPMEQHQVEGGAALEEQWKLMIIIACIVQLIKTRDSVEPSQTIQKKHPTTTATSAHKERKPDVTSHPEPPSTPHPHLTHRCHPATKPVITGEADQITRCTSGGKIGTVAEESRAAARSIDKGHTLEGRAPACPAVTMTITITWHRQPPRRQLTVPHPPAHRKSTAHTSGDNTKQPPHSLPTSHSQQRADPGGGKIKAGQGGPSDTGTDKPAQEETNPERESWADEMERVEGYLTRGNRSRERTGGEKSTTRETHFKNMETIDTVMRKMQIGKQPQPNAGQASKGGHAQVPDRTNWTRPRHSRHRNTHPDLWNNNFQSPQHLYYNTWKKWIQKHKPSTDEVGNPRGPPRKPLIDRIGTRTERIGLGDLTLGRADNACSPRQPHKGEGRGHVRYPDSNRCHANTHKTTTAHPPGSGKTSSSYGGRTPLHAKGTPRPASCSPNHTPYGQAMRGQGSSRRRSTQPDLPLSWRQSPAEPPASPTGTREGWGNVIPCRKMQPDYKRPETPRLGLRQPSQMYRDRVYHLLLS